MEYSLPARVTDPADLKLINYFLHDATFLVSALSVHPTGAVDILFTWPGVTRRMRMPWRRSPAEAAESTYVLTVRNVSQLDVRDPDRLERHTLAQIEFAAPDILVLSSNFPGEVRMRVDGIDLALRSKT